MLPAIDRICAEAAAAVREGYTLLVLSDRIAGKEFVPIRLASSQFSRWS